MAFKQKSGSPFARNFGIGKSPVKQTKKSPVKSWGDKAHMDEYGPTHRNHEKEPLQMKSPMKDTGSQVTSRLINDGFPRDKAKEAGDLHTRSYPYAHTEHKSRQNKPEYGSSSLQMKSAFKKHTDMHDEDSDIITSKLGETPVPMKSSGFKMKSGSPFQRNFGIGDTASPMKKFGVYESIIDEETGEKETTQVSRDKIKDITAQRNELQKQIKEIEENNPDGIFEGSEVSLQLKDLQDQLSTLNEAAKKFTLTGKDAALGTTQAELDEWNERLIREGKEPITMSQYAAIPQNIREEGKVASGMIQELQKDKSGRTSQTHFDVDEQSQLIDELTLHKNTPQYSPYGDQSKRTKPAVSSKILDDIQDKIDAGKELTPDEKVIQETYIDVLGAGGNVMTGAEVYQPGTSPNVGGERGYGFDEEGVSVDIDEETGRELVGGVVATDEIDPETGDFKYEQATTENVNLYKHPKTGKMVPLDSIPPAHRGRIIASQKKEQASIDAQKEGLANYNKWREERGPWDENSGQSYEDFKREDMEMYKKFTGKS